MKKILFIALASVFALASCTKFEHDGEYKAVTTGSPVISNTDSTQTSLSAVVTPADVNTTYYSYAVVEGGAYDIDPATLLSASVKGAIAQGCFNVADSASIRVKVAELDAGETYTLYAVASTKTGTISPVAKHMFILDDQAVPAFKLSSITAEVSADSSVVMSIPFNRNIKLAEGAKVVAKTWGVYDATKLQKVSIQGEEYYLNQHPLEIFEISRGKSLYTDENILVVVIPKEQYQDGKYVSITFAAGTVISLPVSEGAPAGKPCAAYNAEYLLYEEGPYAGVFFHYEPSTFSFAESKDNPSFIIDAFWKDARISVVSPVAIATSTSYGSALYLEIAPDYSYVNTKEAPFKQENLTYNEAKDTLTYSLPLAPKGGEMLSIGILEGKFFDIFGNSNEEFQMKSTISVGKLDMSFEEKMGCNLFECTVKAGVDGAKFICDYYEGAASDSTDATLINNMKAYIQKWAVQDEISFAEEYETYFANTGKGTVSSDINLESEKTFTVYGFFMESDGTVLSEVFRKEIKTAKFEWPSETTGTFTYATSPFKAMGAQPGTPISINAAKDTITISNFGTNGVDLKCAVDKSGNMKVVLTPVMKHATYGLVYANEIEDWYQKFYEEPWGSQSYYNSLDKTIYFNIVYHIATGGYFGVGQFADTFCFDNSQPAAAPTSAKKTVGQLTLKTNKVANSNKRHIK